MLKDCLEIFQKQLNEQASNNNEDRMILGEYVPADGDYLIVQRDGMIGKCSIKMDKKTRIPETEWEGNQYENLCFFDYHSRLVSMDKPQDPKKIIHSNNYMSFWVKWDSMENGKCDELAIDRYFNILKNPEEKYKKSKDREMYEYIAKQIGDIDQEQLEKNRMWIKNHLFELDKFVDGLNKKNYLKIFFEADPECYIKEEKRYLITKIYNKNDYNIEFNNQIYGLPNDNLGLNSKKPYMENKTRKITVPYLIDPMEAVLQRKFFDYLMNQANLGRTNIFFDYDTGEIIPLKKGELIEGEFSGFFLQIKKGKEIEIHHQDTIVDYKYNLSKKFSFENVLDIRDEEELYKEYRNKEQMQALIDRIIFSKWLIGNYFMPESDISADGELKRNLLLSRNVIFAWIYKGQEENVGQILNRVCRNMIRDSLQKGYWEKSRRQFNFMCSLEKYFGGNSMADKYQEIRGKLRTKINENQENVLDSDREYFYAVGQLTYYFISLSQSKELKHSLANPVFNATNTKVISQKLQQFFMKYNYTLNIGNKKFNRLYAMVSGYEVEEKICQQDIIAGYLSNNLLYESNERKEEV